MTVVRRIAHWFFSLEYFVKTSLNSSSIGYLVSTLQYKTKEPSTSGLLDLTFFSVVEFILSIFELIIFSLVDKYMKHLLSSISFDFRVVLLYSFVTLSNLS